MRYHLKVLKLSYTMVPSKSQSIQQICRQRATKVVNFGNMSELCQFFSQSRKNVSSQKCHETFSCMQTITRKNSVAVRPKMPPRAPVKVRRNERAPFASAFSSSPIS